MSSLTQMIAGITQAAPEKALTDDEAWESFSSQFVPSLAAWPGKESNLPIGEEKAKALLLEGRNKARKKREGNASKVAKAQRNVRLESFVGAASALMISGEIAALAVTVAKDGGALTTVVAEDGAVSFTVTGVKAATGGNNGGGRIADDSFNGFIVAETGERSKGPLTFWAKKNVEKDEYKELCLRPNGKKRSGEKLGTRLVEAGYLTVDPDGIEAVSEETEAADTE